MAFKYKPHRIKFSQEVKTLDELHNEKINKFDETNKVIDLTARQFTVTVPAKFVAQLEDWLDEASEWLGDSLVYSLFDNPDTMKPSYESQWIREEIDPHEFIREEAGMKELQKQIAKERENA